MNNFFLVKITKPEFAHSLLSGSIYMQSLQYFREQWENYNKAQVDTNEGTIGIIGGTSIENHIENLRKIGAEEVADFWENIHHDFKANITDFGTKIEHSDFNDKIFCLYTFYFNDISKEYQIPNTRLIEFAEEKAELSAVIIHNPSEFLKRMQLAISKIGNFSFDKVRYKNFSKTHDIDSFGAFHKDMEYSWQQEFRVACIESREQPPTTMLRPFFSVRRQYVDTICKPRQETFVIQLPKPLTLNIGNISDIAIVINDINCFFDSAKFTDIMAENNIEIKDYIPIEKQFCQFEQDIAYCLHIESLLSNDLYLIEADALEHYNEAVDFMYKADHVKAKQKLNEYKKAVQQEPLATDSIPIERSLMRIYLRLAENYLGLADKENLLFYHIKQRCFYNRLWAKGVNTNNDVGNFTKRADKFLKDFDKQKHFNENIPAAIAALENATFIKR